jgi:hypothetical protein
MSTSTTTLESLQEKYKSKGKFNSDDILFLLNLQIQERGADHVYVNEAGNSGDGGCFNTLQPVKEFVEETTYLGAPFKRPVLDFEADPIKGCIVGSFLVDLVEGDTRRVPRTGSYASTFRELGVLVTEKAGRLAGEVQVRQDKGQPWGQAVAEGKEYVDSLFSDEDNYLGSTMWSGVTVA